MRLEPTTALFLNKYPKHVPSVASLAKWLSTRL